MTKNEQVGARIKSRREYLGFTLQQVADQVGVAGSTIQRYERGLMDKLKLPVIMAIARALDTDAAWLLSGSAASMPASGMAYHPTRRIPILGHISAGLPLYAEQHIEGHTYTDRNGGAEYFALKVKGDSMNAARIADGDLLIVRKQDVVENGQIAIVLVGDEDATVKRFYQNGNIVSLVPQSTNPEHQIQIYDLRETPVRIIGLVVENKISY